MKHIVSSLIVISIGLAFFVAVVIIAVLISRSAEPISLDLSGFTNVAAFWGQGTGEKDLAFYCKSGWADIIVISFINGFGQSRIHPTIDLASHCWRTFPKLPDLLHCPQTGDDIKICQRHGKTVLISIGGARGRYGFSSATEAERFAEQVWEMFLGGNRKSASRPFDGAVLDGVDLDIEIGNDAFYANFVSRLRSLMAGSSKKDFLITASPQCPFPDSRLGPDGVDAKGTILGGTAFSVAAEQFDVVWPQFYNAAGCQIGGAGFRHGLESWNSWAAIQNTSLFIGTTAAKEGNLVTIDQLKNAISFAVRNSSQFRGVIFWDAQSSAASGRGPSISKWLKSLKH